MKEDLDEQILLGICLCKLHRLFVDTIDVEIQDTSSCNEVSCVHAAMSIVIDPETPSTQAVVYNYQPMANGVLKNPNQLVDVPGVGYAAFFNKNPMALAICENYQKRDKERLKVWYESYSDWINSA